MSCAMQSGQLSSTVDRAQASSTIESGQVASSLERGQVPNTLERGQVSSTLGRGQVPNTLERGQVSSTLERGQVSSTLERGPVTSTMERGPVSSTMERGPVSSTVERGQVSSTLERGQVSSTLERGPVTSTMERGPVSSTVERGPVSSSLECGQKEKTRNETKKEEKGKRQSETKLEKKIFDEYKQKVLWAMLNNDNDTYHQLVSLNKTPDAKQKLRIQRLLLRRQNFPFPGKYNPPDERPADRFKLLALFPPEKPWQKSQDLTLEQQLERKLQSYRGFILHLAAVLNRKLMFGRTMVIIFENYGLHKAEKLLMERDSERNSTLEVAQAGQCRETLSSICYILRDTANHHGWGAQLARRSLCKALICSTRCLYLGLDTKKLMLCVQNFANRFLDFRELSLYWPILSQQFEYIRYLVRSERRSVVDDIGLPMLHWAVMLYSRTSLTWEKREILEFLVHESDLPPSHRLVSPNETSSIWFMGRRMFGGTAVHFALYPHIDQEPENPSDWEADGPLSAQMGDNIQLQLRDALVSRVENESRTPLGFFQVLEFLHVHGVDFTLPDELGKTPLDLVPADADPEIIDTLLAYQVPCHPEEQCQSY